jgi:hypothetical protein
MGTLSYSFIMTRLRGRQHTKTVCHNLEKYVWTRITPFQMDMAANPQWSPLQECVRHASRTTPRGDMYSNANVMFEVIPLHAAQKAWSADIRSIATST